MGKLYATDNFKTGTWSLDASSIGSQGNDLFITFTEEAPIITFKNLKFGYELRQNGNIMQYGVYPPPGIKYRRSDQEYLISVRLELEIDESYSLFLWAENDKQKIQKEFDIKSPRPPQPYDSWSWDPENKFWKSPVSKPDDGDTYDWDESTLSWVPSAEYTVE